MRSFRHQHMCDDIIEGDIMDQAAAVDILAILEASSAKPADFLKAKAFWKEVSAEARSRQEAERLLVAVLRRQQLIAQSNAVIGALAERSPNQSLLAVHAAKLALEQNDYDAAEAQAAKVILNSPSSGEAWRIKLQALLRGGRMEDAEIASTEAVKRFPSADWSWRNHAEAAAMRGDGPAAMQRYADLRRKFPEARAGYLGAARFAQEHGQGDVARALIAEGLFARPDDGHLLSFQERLGKRAVPRVAAGPNRKALALKSENPDTALAAVLAVARLESRKIADGREAFGLFDALHARFPGFSRAYVAHVDTLISAGRTQQAVALAKRARALLAPDVALGLAHVRALNACHDHRAALDVVRELQAMFSATPAIAATQIHVLADAGQDEEAERLAKATLATAPRAVGVWREYARLATRRGDWTEALERWREALRHQPGDKAIARQVQMAQLQACITEEVQASESVFHRFESLGGDTLGCEFGMMQRDGGSDTVGLLRWASIPLENLVEALNLDFEGFGTEQQTKLVEVTEYYGLRDTRYGMFTHTYVKRADAPHDKMFTQSCRRMRFLANKINEDLEAGEKVFVYKTAHDLSNDQLYTLHDAVRRRGDAPLLCFKLASGLQSKGSVRSVRPGLFVGHVEYFMANVPSGQGANIDKASYHEVCSRVAALVPQKAVVPS